MERERLSSIVEKIREDGRLSIEAMTELADAFGDGFQKALAAVREGRVKRYHFTPGPMEAAIVVGHEREYLLMPEVWYCGCKALYPKGLREGPICYHMLAYKLAEALDVVEEVEMEAESYEAILDELKYGGSP
jgi:predicted nucleic acid-binding Zn finger protein